MNNKYFDLEKIVAESFNYSEVVKKLGMTKTGRTVKKVHEMIDQKGISTDHFTSTMPTVRNNENIFCKGSTADQKTTKKYFKKLFPEEKCSICGLPSEWNGMHLEMVLDHINGDHTDNRLDNLRYVCPNCNSQLETTAGRNIVYQRQRKEKEACINEVTVA